MSPLLFYYKLSPDPLADKLNNDSLELFVEKLGSEIFRMTNVSVVCAECSSRIVFGYH